MYRIHQIKVPFDHDLEDVKNKAVKFLGIKASDIKSFSILKRSIDARKEVLQYVYAVDIDTYKQIKTKFKPNEVSIVNPVQYNIPVINQEVTSPVIVGLGPAGLFCGYLLAKAGFKPICIERGKDAYTRKQDVDDFFENGKLNTESNVCFGEGGAGTFSDGKLNTLIKDKDGKGRFVLKVLHEFGADEDILYDSKPHVGTDKLIEIVTNMRKEIENLGGKVMFSTKLTNIIFENDKVVKAEINNTDYIDTDRIIVATGHSARDTFEMLNNLGLDMSPKPYAIGVRVLHKQELINKSQYGNYADKLPAASYKVTHTCKNDRGVYSFCMCPGGYVVNASNEANATVVNGMSYSDRAGEFANSAIVCTVTPEDYMSEGFGNDALSGVRFQKHYESLAYNEAKGGIPVQKLKAFKNNNIEEFNTDTLPVMGKCVSSNIRNCLPVYVSDCIVEGMDAFDKKINGFGDDNVVLCGIETRTSSPVRVNRDESYQTLIKGIYPCGEGAGYAGGIMSAALDGVKIAEQIIGEII